MTGFAQGDRGQTLVEFAGIATLFLLLTFAIMQMGLAVCAYNTVCEASREAVRYAAVHSPTSANPATTGQIQQVAITAAPGLNLTDAGVSVSWPPDPNIVNTNDAEVQVDYSYSLKIPFVAPMTIPLTSTARMLVSQ